MTKRVLLSANELMEAFQVALEDHIGGSLTVSLIRDVIESTLDHYCYGRITRNTTQAVLVEYGVAPDLVQQITDRLHTSLLTVIQRGFGIIHPTRSYSYQWLNNHTLLVEESQYRLPPVEEASNDDNGDYIPERMRRR